MTMDVPRVIVNLKNYAEARGAKAVAMAKASARVARELGVSVAVCPSALDLQACVAAGARVFSQSVDRVERPESTGWLSAEALREAGAEGTLINHSEHRLARPEIGFRVEAARRARLVSVVCSKDAAESGDLASLGSEAVAVEPPELIGGEVSVTKANPDAVRGSVRAVLAAAPRARVLCGAGVKTAADVAKAVELGAWGILVASGVTRAKDPAGALAALCNPFQDPGRR